MNPYTKRSLKDLLDSIVFGLLVGLFIFVVLSCQGCGTEHDLVVDPELEPLLSQYLSMAPDNGHLDEVTSIQFGELGAGDHGLCEIERAQVNGFTYETTRKITIRRPGVGMRLDTTVFHELGHCLHDLEHTGGEWDIMNPARVRDNTFWEENMARQLGRMFTR